MSKSATPKKSKIVPLYDRVIIKQDEASDYKGKIYIPDSAKEKMQTGVVRAAGIGRVSDLTNEIRPMAVKAGDKVIFGMFSGDPIVIDNEVLLMMREDHIYGILKEASD